MRLLLSLAVSFALPLSATSLPWTVLSIQETGLSGLQQGKAVLSAAGDIYWAVSGRCPVTTLAIAPTAQASSCFTKINASGQQAFSVQIGGAAGLSRLLVDAAGNVFLSGYTADGFATTPGAYEPSPAPANAPFICKFSGTDGHPLFCTAIDISASFALDPAGNTYSAGACSLDYIRLCVEKLNATGTGLDYSINLPVLAGNTESGVDAAGDLFVVAANNILKLNSLGSVIATATTGDTATSLALDPAGNPQVLASQNPAGPVHIRRYSADLATVLFDTPIDFPNLSWGMSIDATGVTTLWNATRRANLPPVHPTQPCFPGGSPILARLDNHGSPLQLTYLDLPSVFLSGFQMTYNIWGGELMMSTPPTGNWQILQLGPTSSEVNLSCIGNAASLANVALAPDEIVSLFGSGIGPAEPIAAQPDENGVYPFELGSTQVTFDGIPAPLLSVGSSQINLVTPHSLQGRTTTHICAVVDNLPTNCLDVPVTSAAPGLFAVVNQDGTINSSTNPAPSGSVVSLFVTGLGAMTPSPPDGSTISIPPPSQTLSIQVQYHWSDLFTGIQTEGAQVLYLGPAPLEVEGLEQINVVAVPAPPGIYPTQASTIQVQPLAPDGLPIADLEATVVVN